MNNLPFLLSERTIENRDDLLNEKIVYIFHHFIICGGTSVTYNLKYWFNIIDDHLLDPDQIEQYIKTPVHLDKLEIDNCLIGHYNYEGIYLHQRYPEILLSINRIKSFTFIREPLNFWLSFYFYSKKFNRAKYDSFLDFSDDNMDLLAYFLPCDEFNYQKVLDSYFFIGITDKLQESFDKLAMLLNKRKITMPVLNLTNKDSLLSFNTEDFKVHFKQKNKLDYLIYQYCLDKFELLDLSYKKYDNK